MRAGLGTLVTLMRKVSLQQNDKLQKIARKIACWTGRRRDCLRSHGQRARKRLGSGLGLLRQQLLQHSGAGVVGQLQESDFSSKGVRRRELAASAACGYASVQRPKLQQMYRSEKEEEEEDRREEFPTPRSRKLPKRRPY